MKESMGTNQQRRLVCTVQQARYRNQGVGQFCNVCVRRALIRIPLANPVRSARQVLSSLQLDRQNARTARQAHMVRQEEHGTLATACLVSRTPLPWERVRAGGMIAYATSSIIRPGRKAGTTAHSTHAEYVLSEQPAATYTGAVRCKTPI
jgi:hypothetical protein